MRKTYKRSKKSLRRKSRRSGGGISPSKMSHSDIAVIAAIAASAAAGAAVTALLGSKHHKGQFTYKHASPLASKELHNKFASMNMHQLCGQSNQSDARQ